jgi:hypothetical protein
MNYCVVPLLMIYFRYSDARVDIQYTVFRHISLVHWCVGLYRFPCTMIIGVFFGICMIKLPLSCLRNKSWKPECVLSFNMGWRILVNFIPRWSTHVKKNSITNIYHSYEDLGQRTSFRCLQGIV